MVRGPAGFQPGNKAASKSTNPRGRFITQRLISMMHEEIGMMELDPKDPKHKKMIMRRTSRLNFYCEKLFELALNGDMQAIKYIADRIEGTPIQTTVSVEEFDPQALEQQRARLADTRAKLKDMTDAERTALYFQTLGQASGASGSTKPN